MNELRILLFGVIEKYVLKEGENGSAFLALLLFFIILIINALRGAYISCAWTIRTRIMLKGIAQLSDQFRGEIGIFVCSICDSTRRNRFDVRLDLAPIG